MPFGLNNAGATYQRLVNRMFKDKLGDSVEVYIDDMVVKSKRAKDHLRDLGEAFYILNEYKCHFGMKACKFLGNLVAKRGIEGIHEHIKAIIDLRSPTSTKDIKKFTGRVAYLNRFI